MEYYGILGICKPSGMTSFDVVRILKKKIGTKKIGHGGTLDPMASGVLPVLIGDATAFFDAVLHSPKTYRAVIQLGACTDTDDKEGKIVREFEFRTFSDGQIRTSIDRLTGEISQIPPQYSALKVNGQRAYALARAGQKAPLQPRTVQIYAWDSVIYNADLGIISAEITCSSGTYIRSLARDLGAMLGIGAYLSLLERTAAGGIRLEDCIQPDAENWHEKILAPEHVLNFMPAAEWTGSLEHLKTGRPLPDLGWHQGLNLLMFKNEIAALVFADGKKISYQKNFAHRL